MGIKILVPVKRSTKLHKNKDQISASLKANSDIIKENNNTDKMIDFFERENKAARWHELRLFQIMFNNQLPQNSPAKSQNVLKQM